MQSETAAFGATTTQPHLRVIHHTAGREDSCEVTRHVCQSDLKQLEQHEHTTSDKQSAVKYVKLAALQIPLGMDPVKSLK